MIRTRRPWAVVASMVAWAAVLLYVLIVVRQSASDDMSDARLVVGVMVLLVSLAGLTVVGAVSPRTRVRKASLGAAALGWFVFGYLALWSVGLLLIVAGILAILALLRDRDAQA